jgi:hypothetical protein
MLGTSTKVPPRRLCGATVRRCAAPTFIACSWLVLRVGALAGKRAAELPRIVERQAARVLVVGPTFSPKHVSSADAISAAADPGSSIADDERIMMPYSRLYLVNHLQYKIQC